MLELSEDQKNYAMLKRKHDMDRFKRLKLLQANVDFNAFIEGYITAEPLRLIGIRAMHITDEKAIKENNSRLDAISMFIQYMDNILLAGETAEREQYAINNPTEG